MSNFNLMILAAGFGKRMKNLTQFKPKPLLQINNKELLSHNIDFFLDLGCSKIVINTHFYHDQISKFIKLNYQKKNIELLYEPSLLSTGGGIKNAINTLGNKNFLVTNSDILWNKDNKDDVLEFIKALKEVKTCKLLLSENKKFYGLKKRTGDFKLEKKLIKRWSNNDPLIYFSGLQIINPKIFAALEKKIFSMNFLWDLLILDNQLEGHIIKSCISHIGDKKAYDQIKNN